MTSAAHRDTYTQHQFGIEIAGVVNAIFDEVSGLGAKMDVFEVKEGGLNGYIHRLPGRVTHSNITLKWGSAYTTALYDWYASVVSKADKQSELKNISILQLDQRREEVRRWNLTNAFPVDWKGPAFNASTSAIAVESMEIAYSNLTMVKKG
jgi:phage tail-like protein